MAQVILMILVLAAMTATIVIQSVLLYRKRTPKPDPNDAPQLLTGYGAASRPPQNLRDEPDSDEDEELKERLYYLLENDKLYLNPDIRIFPVSAKTGDGMAALEEWLLEETKAWQA